jgi:iron complex transport system ATP-binding protein
LGVKLLDRHTDLPWALEPGTVALQAHDLGVRVAGQWLLREVDLHLRTGELLVVVGPNGAGKSTLLSLLAGDLAPTTGRVSLGELPVDRTHPLELARRRAVLLQRVGLSFPFEVSEVVAMGRAPWVGTEREDLDELAVATALAATDMEAFAHRRFPTLSGGEQARAAFARTLAQQTDVLLLDEPTAALDLRHQEQLMATARACADAGNAVLVVLHDLQLAAAYADEIAVLGAGRLVARGAPRDVLTDDLLSDIYGLPIEVLHHPRTGAVLVGPQRSPISRKAQL